VRAGGRVTFRGFSSVLARSGAWPAGAKGYYEVEVLDMGEATQVLAAVFDQIGFACSVSDLRCSLAGGSFKLLRAFISYRLSTAA
jgi:hypothetical protein